MLKFNNCLKLKYLYQNSGSLFKILTEETQKEMRHIDRVTVKGSVEPMDFYTCDLDLVNLMLKVKRGELDKYNSQKLSKAERKKLKVYNRLKRNELKKKVMENKTTVANLFVTDKELRAMRENFPKVLIVLSFLKKKIDFF